MKKAYWLILTFLTLFCALSKAQTYVVPVHYVLKSQDDFTRYEADIIKTVDWLQQTPWSQEADKRRQATDFLFKWIQGTPNITMELMPALINLTDRNNQLMAIFIGAYTKYAIQHPRYDKDDANLAAVKAVIEKYRAEPAHKKDIDIEHLSKYTDTELKEWVLAEYERPAT